MTGLRKRSGSSGTKQPVHCLEGDSEADSGFVTPDSTTGCPSGANTSYSKRSNTSHSRHEFRVGEEVLSHSKDGRFYLGNIVEIDEVSCQCLVQFADNTAHWSLFKDLRNLKVPESDELCTVCKSSKTTPANEIVLCHRCEKGYHQNCLQPRIGPCYTEVDSEWECPLCCPQDKKQKRDAAESGDAGTVVAASPRKTRANRTSNSHQQQEEELDNKQKLPYDLKMLHWDAGHKMNQEQTYCYCGGPGEWYNRMLQCNRCRQWFHEACLDSLHYSLLYGDRFYVFVCTLCNESCGEFVHRVELRWVDAVHLAMFNLTLHDVKTYFDYDLAITRWINNNWELLQAPLEMQNVCVEDRRREVLRILESNRPRFKCGREVRKRACVWGLRSRVPPPVPSLRLPPGPVTEEIIRQYISPASDAPGNSPPIPRTVRLRDDKSHEDSCPPPHYSPAKKRALSPTAPPPATLLHHLNTQLSAATAASHSQASSAAASAGPLTAHNSCSNSNHNSSSSSSIGGGAAAVTATVSTAPITNNNNNNNKTMATTKAKSPPNHGEGPGRRKRKGELDKLMEDKKAKKMIEEVSNQLSELVPRLNQHQSSMDVSAIISRKRKRGRPPKTPPTLRRGDGQSCDAKVSSFHSSSCSSTSIPDDTSDDASSHGTLESFIPPPSNFEGHNNPFLHLVPPAAAGATGSCSAAAGGSRPSKRKLSQSDIRIGKNGEVKRRKFRAKKPGSLLEDSATAEPGVGGAVVRGVTGTGNVISSTAMVTTSGSIRNCLDYALSARLGGGGGGEEGRGSQEGVVTESSRVSFNDLKSTVNNYFGAANRIANGEKFHVLARRVSYESNKVQYLIEWDCATSS